VGRDDIFEVDASIQKFVDLQVVVVVRLPRRPGVVVFREESRRPQYDTGQTALVMEQFTQVLGRKLGRAIDVFRQTGDVLGNPGGRRTGRRCERSAECAGGAGETKDVTPAETASSSKFRVPVMLVSTKSWRPWVAMCGLWSVAVCKTTSTLCMHALTKLRSVTDPT